MFSTDIIISFYSSKKMGTLIEHFQACILAFANKNWYCILKEFSVCKMLVKMSGNIDLGSCSATRWVGNHYIILAGP